MQKKKVTSTFFNIYQSIFFMPPGPLKGNLILLIKISFQSESSLCFNYAKEMNIDERFCEE